MCVHNCMCRCFCVHAFLRLSLRHVCVSVCKHLLCVLFVCVHVHVFALVCGHVCMYLCTCFAASLQHECACRSFGVRPRVNPQRQRVGRSLRCCSPGPGSWPEGPWPEGSGPEGSWPGPYSARGGSPACRNILASVGCLVEVRTNGAH